LSSDGRDGPAITGGQAVGVRRLPGAGGLRGHV